MRYLPHQQHPALLHPRLYLVAQQSVSALGREQSLWLITGTPLTAWQPCSLPTKGGESAPPDPLQQLTKGRQQVSTAAARLLLPLTCHNPFVFPV